MLIGNITEQELQEAVDSIRSGEIAYYINQRGKDRVLEALVIEVKRLKAESSAFQHYSRLMAIELSADKHAHLWINELETEEQALIIIANESDPG